MGTGDILAHAQDNGGDTGYLYVSGNISRDKTGTSMFDLRSDENISISSAIIDSSTGEIDIILNADRDADENGRISIYNSTITTNGGYFVAGGGAGDIGGTNGILGDGDGTGADDIAAFSFGESNNGIAFSNSTLTTSDGNIILHGNAKGTGTDDGIGLAGTDLDSGEGWISISGVSSGDLSHSYGVAIQGYEGGPASSITSTTGNIDIYGEAPSRPGIIFWRDSSVSSTDGDITLTASTSSSQGIIGGGDPVTQSISSTNGNVTLRADGLNLATYTSIYAGDTLYIFTFDPTTTIGLGTGSTGSLSLNNTELGILSAGNKIVIGEDGVQTGDMDVDLWDLSDTDFDVEFYANDIALGGITMGTGDILAHAQDNGGDTGDLTVDGNIARDEAGTSTLDLRADQDIYITSANIQSDTGAVNVILNADRDADMDGRLILNTTQINTNGGYFVAGGGSGDVGGVDGILGNGDGTGADDNFAYASGFGDGANIQDSIITTSDGDLILNGYARGAGTDDGIHIQGTSSLTSGDGRISLTGTSTGDTSGPTGIVLYGTTSVSSAGGNIDITATSTNDYGFRIADTTGITTTDGNITITASSSTLEDIYGDGNTISSTNNNVTLNVNDIYLDGMTSVSAGDTLSIFTRDQTTTIGLGGGTGVLNLNTTELSKLSAGNKIIIGEDGVQKGDMDIDAWDLSDTAFDVAFYANDITMAGIDMGTGDILAHAQDHIGETGSLTVDGNIERSVDGISTLDLRADLNIYLATANIVASDVNSDGDGAPTTDADSINVILNSDRDGDENGRINADANISTNGGFFVAGGGNGDIGGVDGILGNGDGTGADDNFAYGTLSGHGIWFYSTNINTAGGDVYIHAYAKGAGTDNGFNLDQSSINSGAGHINITGITTGDTNSPVGISLSGNTATTVASLTSTSGNIDLTASSTNDFGYFAYEDTNIYTADGNITITTASPVTNDISGGGTTPSHTISSTNGHVTLNIDDAYLDNLTSIHAGDTLSIFTRDPTTTIGLGGGTGVLNLNATELSKLSAGNKIIIGESGVQTGDMDIDLWDLSGTTFDVEFYANDIAIGGVTMGTGDILTHAQDNGGDTGYIAIDGHIDRSETGTSTLDLRADQSIYMNSATNIESTTGAINIILNADRDADEDGRILVRDAIIDTNGGYFVAGGGSGNIGGIDGILGNGDGTGADDSYAYNFGASGDGVHINTVMITTSGGDVIINGNAKDTGTDDGIHLDQSTINSGNGRIQLRGTSTGDISGPDGIYLSQASLNSLTGNIDLIGTSTNQNGVYFSTADNSISTTDGDITITASSSAIDLRTGGSTTHSLTSINGNITINANEIYMEHMLSISAGDTLSIFSIDPTTTIGLGTGSTGVLNLNNTELGILSAGNKIIIGEDGVQTGDMDVNAWDLSDTDFDVEFYANDISLGGITMGTGDILANAQDNGGDTGNLTIDGNIDRDEAGTSLLDLRADQDISITAANIDSDTGAINVILNSDRDADEDGQILINTSSIITTNGGYFVAGGGSGDIGGIDGILGNGDGTGADDSFAYAFGTGRGIGVYNSSQISTSGGDIILRGYAKGAGSTAGVILSEANLSSGDGWISIEGISNEGTRALAFYGQGTSTDITSTGGNIDITGTTLNVADHALRGLETVNITTVDGDITITTSAASAIDMSFGGTTPNHTISSTNGNVTINADDVYLDEVDSISAGDTLSIFTIDPTTTIGLGTGSTGVLNLNDDELAMLSAGNKIVIGENGVQTGDMDVDLWDLSDTDFDVELYANDIALGGVTMGTGDLLAHAQDNGGDTGWIYVDSNIERDEAGTSTLNLRADNGILITSADITSATGAIDVILNADRDGDEDGRVSLNTVNITTNGGYFVAGGGAGDIGGVDGILGNDDGTGADDNFAYAVGAGDSSGIILYNTNITTAGGDAIFHGYAKGAGTNDGAIFVNSQIRSGDGHISISGTSTGDSASTPTGVGLSGSSSQTILETANGNIDIIANSTNDDALFIYEDVSITTIGGNITITSTSSAGDDIHASHTGGINQTISSTNANVTLNVNNAAIDNMFSIYAGDTLSIFTIDPTTTIGLGDGATGTLHLDDDELALLSAGNKIVIGEDGVQTGDMDVNAWDLSDTDFDVEFYANDISLGGIKMGTGDILAHAQDNGGDTGNLTIDGNIERDEAGTSILDLRADQDISITAANIDSDTGAINVILNSDRDADEDGRIFISASTINTNGGYFVAGGGSGDIGGIDGILGNGDGTGADDSFSYSVGANSGIRLLDSNIITSGGDAIFHGYAKGAGTEHGVYILDSSISSDDGWVSLTGTSTGDTNNPKGIQIGGNTPDTTYITTTSGHIDLTATATNNNALYLWKLTSITTDDGNITITASSSSNSDLAAGGSSADNTISSTNGNIILNVDDIGLNEGTSIHAGDTLSIFTIDPTTTIGLGDGATGLLNLNDDELAMLSAGNKIVIGKDGVQTGDMDVDAWDLSGTAFDLELYANDITFGGIDMGAGNILVHAQDNGVDLGVLDIDGNITRGVDGTALLDLRADNDIISNAGVSITATDANSDTDGDEETDADSLTVILNANRDGIVGNDEGKIDLVGMTITTLGGNVIMGGGTDPENTATYGSQAIVLDSTNITTGAGDIYMTGIGNTGTSGNNYGVAFTNNSDLTTTSGDMIITGTAQSTGTNSAGVYARTVDFSTETGQIEITGVALGDNTDNNGIHGSSGFDISSTGTGAGVGDIILTGTTAGDAAAIFIEGYRDITVYDADVTLTGNNGDIILDNPITKLGGTEEINVTLQADKGIYLTSEGDITSSGGVMNVVLNADRDGDEDGRISLESADITTDGGYFVAGGGSGTLGGVDGILGNGDGTGADDIAAFAVGGGSGLHINLSQVITSGGDIVLTGYAKGAGTERGLYIQDSGLSSEGGWISLKGTTTGDGTNPRGIEINGNGIMTTLLTTDGHINIAATATTSASAPGLLLWKNTNISTTNGDITITATSSSTNDINVGGTTPTHTISSTNGNVTINVDDVRLDSLTSISAGDTLSIQTLDDATTIGLGDATAGVLNLNDTELGILSAGNRIVIGNTDNIGAVHLNNVDFTGSDFILYGGAMTVDGGLGADAISFFSQDEITLNAAVSATEAGNSIIMTGTGFTNTTGLDSLDAGAGRYLIYMDAPSDVTKGGLTGGNYYNATYAGNPPATIGAGLGDRFVYAYQPTLTFTADDIDISPTYDPTYSAFTYSISGLEPDDTALGSYSGTPTFTATETFPGSGIFDISIASGSLSSLIGYNFAFVDGTLTMPGTAPPPVNPPASIPPTTPATPTPPSAGQSGLNNSTNSGAWNPGVEQQIQVKDIWLSYDKTSGEPKQTATKEFHTPKEEWMSYSAFGNSEPHADVRLIQADYMEVEKPVIIFYDLCSYNVNYCGE